MSESAEKVGPLGEPGGTQDASGENNSLERATEPAPPLPELLQAPPDPPADPLVGHVIDGRYKIERHLGEGGMGVVYKAKHVVLGKDLAIKVLRAEVSKDQEIMARFRQEAQSASGIGSQHIIDISDFGQLKDGSTYFVMELLDGKELTTVIEKERPIPPERVAHVGKQLCDALGKAHERGIVHRDMKPDNVFLVRRGKDPDFVKVLDFGIAKVGGANSKLTKAGQVFGTPHYMSPEQCAGQLVDHRTDVYALGVMLYEMAVGRVPFDADNLMGILTKHIYEKPIPPRDLPPPVSVSPGLEAVILKCLEKSTETRYQSMAEVKADLEALDEGRTPNAVVDAVNRAQGRGDPTGAHSPTGSHARLAVEVGQPGGGSKLPLVLGLVVGLLGLVGAGALVYFLVLAPEAPEVPEVVVAAEDPVVEDPVVEDPPEVVETPPAAQETPPPLLDTITVTSNPTGAEVLREDGEGETVFVGNTPFPMERPAARERVRLVLRQVGYVDRTVQVGPSTSRELMVGLVPEPSTGRSGRDRPARDRPDRDRPSAEAEPTPPAEPAAQEPAAEPRSSRGEVLDPWANPRRRAAEAAD